MVVAIAALAGAAIGWRFPFLGRNQSANRLQTAGQTTAVQPTTRKRTLRANQPTRTAQALNNNQTTAQAPNATTSPDPTTSPSSSGSTNQNDPIPALW